MRYGLLAGAIACALQAGLLSVLADQAQIEAVVQRQVDAYNARDLTAFLDTYSDDAQLFEWPDKLLARGRSQLKERYAARFAEPGLHAEIVQRIASGDMVIDHEKVRRMFPEGPGTLEAIAIYEVSNGRIQKVWLRLGDKKLDKDN